MVVPSTWVRMGQCDFGVSYAHGTLGVRGVFYFHHFCFLSEGIPGVLPVHEKVSFHQAIRLEFRRIFSIPIISASFMDPRFCAGGFYQGGDRQQLFPTNHYTMDIDWCACIECCHHHWTPCDSLPVVVSHCRCLEVASHTGVARNQTPHWIHSNFPILSNIWNSHRPEG